MGAFFMGLACGNMLDNALEAWHGPVMLEIEKAASGALEFFRVLHNHGLWLSRGLAHLMGEGAFQFCKQLLCFGTECATIRASQGFPSCHLFTISITFMWI